MRVQRENQLVTKGHWQYSHEYDFKRRGETHQAAIKQFELDKLALGADPDWDHLLREVTRLKRQFPKIILVEKHILSIS